MAKTTIDVLVTELCKRMTWDVTAASQPRADALLELDRAEKWAHENASLSYLTTTGALTLANLGTTAALPTNPQIDAGKDITVSNAAGDSGLEFVPQDEWYSTGKDTYGLWQSDRPYEWTLIGDGSGTLVANFRPSNATGNPLTFAIIYQRVPAALTDSNASTSMLPEGREKTLLLKRAEGVLKRLHRRPGWQELLAEAEAERASLQAQYRTTKEKPWPDGEQQTRKVQRETLAEGA